MVSQGCPVHGLYLGYRRHKGITVSYGVDVRGNEITYSKAKGGEES